MTAAETPAEWVTLRDASDRVGRSVSGLRKAVKRGALPSRYDDAGRLVVPTDALDAYVTETETHEHAPAAPAVPPGAMLVQRDEWERVWQQAGQVADLGRELAEARERAGRAETAQTFLRERVRELQAAADEQRRADVETIAHEHAEAMGTARRRRWWQPRH